eukprot:g19310.t1
MGKKQKVRENFEGTEVETLALTFGEEWAEETFGSDWQNKTVCGVVKEFRQRSWWVDWDFGETTKMTVAEIKKRTKAHGWKPGDEPNDFAKPASPIDDETEEKEVKQPAKKKTEEKEKSRQQKTVHIFVSIHTKPVHGVCECFAGLVREEGSRKGQKEQGKNNDDNKVELTEEEISEDSESEDEAGVEAEPQEKLFSSAKWVKGDPPATPVPDFEGERRFNPNYDTGDATTLTLIFSQYVSMPMSDRWTEWSNMYARQRRNQKGGQIRYIKPVCPNEMLAFICIHIAMGAQQLKRQSDFWRAYVNPLIQYPDLTPIMTEKRFIEIKLIFQPNDPTLKKSSSNPDYDRLHHVRPFVDNLNEVSKTMMSLGDVLSCVYMKDKPGKYGFKVYQANDPESGFAYHLKVYAGAQTLTPVQQSGNGATFDLIMAMVDECKTQKGTVWVTDRYYSSLLLCHELHRKYEQYLIGTIMANRLYGAKDVLDEIKTTEPRGTMNSCYMEDGPPVIVARWKDRRVCTFVSSVQGGALDHVQRIVDSKDNREAINTYAFVELYNQYMGGTDTQDRLRLGSGAERVRRAVKPCYKLFLGLLDTAVTNTIIVYK